MSTTPTHERQPHRYQLINIALQVIRIALVIATDWSELARLTR